MLLLVKQIHLPSETLVHIEGEWRGGEKREGKLLFIWGERGVCAKILFDSSHKTRYTRPDKHSDPAAVSWIDQIKEASERNQSLLKQNELEACERAGGIMRGRGAKTRWHQTGRIVTAGRSRRRSQDNGAIIRRLEDGGEAAGLCVEKKNKNEGDEIDQMQRRLIRGRKLVNTPVPLSKLPREFRRQSRILESELIHETAGAARTLREPDLRR